MSTPPEEETSNALNMERDMEEDMDGYLEALRRLKAEYDNYRRRTEAERSLRDEEAVGKFVETLLPVIEAFEAGMEYDVDSLKPVYDLFMSTLLESGITVINPESGSDFDPRFHEAVEGEGSVIQEVIRSGYGWEQNGENPEGIKKLLRPARVRIGESNSRSES